MSELKELFENNRAWVKSLTAEDPEFFERLVEQQSPKYLWIGCSDSRVPANEIVGLLPGELFVHRNVANVVAHTDINCLSVLQFAVEALKVEHVIVCGHYGCGGIKAAFEGMNGNRSSGLLDLWFRHIEAVNVKHHEEVKQAPAETRLDLMCELNVIEQAVNVAETAIVQNAWKQGQTLEIHGWIYSIANGLLRDLKCTMTGPESVKQISQMKKYSPEASS
jgi:carbonic anhydrase